MQNEAYRRREKGRTYMRDVRVYLLVYLCELVMLICTHFIFPSLNDTYSTCVEHKSARFFPSLSIILAVRPSLFLSPPKTSIAAAVATAAKICVPMVGWCHRFSLKLPLSLLGNWYTRLKGESHLIDDSPLFGTFNLPIVELEAALFRLEKITRVP